MRLRTRSDRLIFLIGGVAAMCGASVLAGFGGFLVAFGLFAMVLGLVEPA